LARRALLPLPQWLASLFIEAFGLNGKIIPGYKGNKEYMLPLLPEGS